MADVMNVALKYCNMQSDINYGQAFGGPSPLAVCHRTFTVEHVDCSDFMSSVGSSCPAIVERQLLTASRVEKTNTSGCPIALRSISTGYILAALA